MAAVLILPVLAAVLVSGPATQADSTQDDADRYFKKLGIIKIPPIPPPDDFALPDLNGRQVRLSDFKGKVVLLDFWTTWCPECRIEMPSLEKLHQRFKDRDFALLAVDLRESQTLVREFFRKLSLSFTALLDSNGQVGRSFGIRSIPTAFIINRDGALIGKAIGSRNWEGDTATALFDRLLETPSPSRRIGRKESNR